MNKLRIATLGVLTAALLLPAAVFAQEDAPERPEGRMRAVGEIIGVVPVQGTFTILTRKGEELGFQTNENTKFRSPDGSIEDIHDLEKGLKALVVAAEQDDGTLLAQMVSVGQPKDRPDIIRLGGEITGVVPVQETFTFMSREGEEYELSTNERTKFHSRDGSVQDIHDLKNGMLAMVGAVRQDDGQLLALVVGVGSPEDRPELDVLDVKAGGEVVAKSGNSFTIQTRNGESISFSVSDNTQYKGIRGFGELEVGMMAAVGGTKTDDGLLAVFVGARNPGDRPQRDPQDLPDRGPSRRGPGKDQGHEEEVNA